MSTVSVGNTTMHFVDTGTGPPIVFLHGNPTSSYLWRNVTEPVAESEYRCIAVDLIGMGRSGRSDSGYRLADHIRFVEAFLDALDLRDITLVGHDWGAVIALDLAGRYPGRIRRVAIMEGHIHPIGSWHEMDDGERELFSALRATGVGEEMVFEKNFFIETVLPSGIGRDLSAAEMNEYRRPFEEPSTRTPILQWAREIPIEGEPADVASIVTANQRVLADPNMPTLLLHGDPGSVIGAEEVDWCRINGRAMTVVNIGSGTHFLPEDRPGPIADALLQWFAQCI